MLTMVGVWRGRACLFDGLCCCACVDCFDCVVIGPTPMCCFVMRVVCSAVLCGVVLDYGACCQFRFGDALMSSRMAVR